MGIKGREEGRGGGLGARIRADSKSYPNLRIFRHAVMYYALSWLTKWSRAPLCLLFCDNDLLLFFSGNARHGGQNRGDER
jgi:hypothetical protein